MRQFITIIETLDLPHVLTIEAHYLVRLLEVLEIDDPASARLARGFITGRLDEASLGGQLKGGVSNAVGSIKKIDGYINRLGAMIGQTTPVHDADGQIDKLETVITQKFPKLTSVAKQYGVWAKRHPVLQSFVILSLTIIGGLAAGPAGSLVAAAISRASTSLLQGETASSAIAKAIKSGLFGYIVGSSGKILSRMLGNVIVRTLAARIPIATLSQEISMVDTNGQSSKTIINLVGTPNQISFVQRLLNQARSSIENKGWNKAARLFSSLGNLQDETVAYEQAFAKNSEAYQQAIGSATNWKNIMAQMTKGFTSLAGQESVES
jgi:hypothetical protein